MTIAELTTAAELVAHRFKDSPRLAHEIEILCLDYATAQVAKVAIGYAENVRLGQEAVRELMER